MPKKKLTIDKAVTDFKTAYRAKRRLIEREKEDFLFSLGEQWSAEDKAKLDLAKIKPITDNRIAPLIYLVTGLQRQNRTDFKAFPEGQEDGIKAEIASALFKHSIKISDFSYKFSDQFKNGITCGESHLELYLDYTDSLINGKPCWKMMHGNCVFPDPASKEYDFSDGRYVYKVTFDITKEDLISLYPEKESKIDGANEGKLNLTSLMGGEEKHRQPKDYKTNEGGDSSETREESFDLLERYYKKWVDHTFVGDKKTGEIKEAESEELANQFIQEYQMGIQRNQEAYQQALQQFKMSQMPQMDEMGNPIPVDIMAAPAMPPIEPPQQDPGRFILIKRKIPEIWCFAFVPGMEEPLSDEKAWFYPKWKKFPIIPYFARFSTAPLEGDDRHLLVQGIVHGVKGVQEKHNKAEMLTIRHLNSSTNSGWLAEEGSWVDEKKVESFGTSPGVNLEYKKGFQKPERIVPMPLSQGHAQISADSAEAIKAGTGINADLLAAQEGGTDSGRAIALRTKQGLVMVQEPFDNASRTQQMAGRFLLSQFSSIYDTATAQKVLGEAFLIKNFPPPMLIDESGAVGPDGMPQQNPMPDPETGEPMQYDKQMAEVAIAGVLAGDLAEYDVAVGEVVASDTLKVANSEEMKGIAEAFPGLIPPDILVEESNLQQSTKNRIMSSLKAQQAIQAQAGGNPPASAA